MYSIVSRALENLQYFRGGINTAIIHHHQINSWSRLDEYLNRFTIQAVRLIMAGDNQATLHEINRLNRFTLHSALRLRCKSIRHVQWEAKITNHRASPHGHRILDQSKCFWANDKLTNETLDTALEHRVALPSH